MFHKSHRNETASLHPDVLPSNPETVSTDFSISDKLYFEPLTLEDVLNVCDLEKPEGVIVQFGGQTSINLAAGLEKHGVKILGNGELTKKLDVKVDAFSASAKEKIEALGGTAEVVNYVTKLLKSFNLINRKD